MRKYARGGRVTKNERRGRVRKYEKGGRVMKNERGGSGHMRREKERDRTRKSEEE